MISSTPNVPSCHATEKKVVLNHQLDRRVELLVLLRQNLVQLRAQSTQSQMAIIFRMHQEDIHKTTYNHSTSYTNLLGLLHCAWKAVQQEPVRALLCVDFVADQPHHDVVTDQLQHVSDGVVKARQWV